MEWLKKLPFHCAWLMLFCCCMLCGATVGIVLNCRGLFYGLVARELGYPVSAFTLHVAFYGVASSIALLRADRIFERFDVRLVLTAGTAIFGLAVSAMGLCGSLPEFYLASFVSGLAGAFVLFYPGPVIIKNWFIKKRGLALGLYSTAAGLAGVVMNPVLNGIIERLGWRQGYIRQGLMVIAFAVPFTLLLVKRPEELGLRPYGENQPQQQRKAAVSAAAARQPAGKEKAALPYLLAICYLVIASGTTTFAQHLPNHADNIGLSSAVGAALSSAAMVGNMCGKTLLGAALDRFRASAVCALSLLASAAGLLFIGFGGAIPLYYFGALIFGMLYFNQMVAAPVVIGMIVPPEQYERAYARVTGAATLSVSIAPTLIAAFFDIFQSYQVVIIVLAGGLLAAMAMMLAALKNREGKT